ncbi:MAG: radical SAM protein [Methanosarcinales archaeon]|nr:radical SAM protein [Methanosarcinales archaeon]
MHEDTAYPLYNRPWFSVWLDAGGNITMKGILAPAIKPFTSDLLDLFENEKPIGTIDANGMIVADGEQLIFSTWMPPIPSAAFDRLTRSQFNARLGKNTPDQVTISVTEECPNRCIHCALPDTDNRESLSPDAVKDVIDQVIGMGTTMIIFDGGEPMVYPKLAEVVRHVDPDKAIATVFTSGTGLTREIAESLRGAGLFAVNVSLDSPNPAEHDYIRGRSGVFDDALAAIKNSLAAGLLVDIYVVLSPMNIGDLKGFYSLAVETGVHELSFYEIVPTGRWINHESDVLSEEDRETLDSFVKWAADDGRVRVFSIPHAMKTTGCFAGRRWLHITPQGDVLPCACIPKSYGNIFEEKVRDIWKRIRKDPAYNVRTARSCLMRNPEFRRDLRL